VLYDADCAFCAASARWLQRRDRDERLTFVPLQDAASAVEPWLDAVAGHDLRAALHVIDAASGRVTEGGAAMLAVLAALPRWRLLAGLGATRPAAPLVEAAYRVVANHRLALGRIFGAQGPACRLPPAGGGRVP